MNRYEGLVLSVCGDGKAYTLLLETDPSEDDPQSRQYFTRFPTRLGYSRVSDMLSNSQCQFRHAQNPVHLGIGFEHSQSIMRLYVSFTKVVPSIVEHASKDHLPVLRCL